MKGRKFKLQSCLAGVNPRFWKPTKFPGKASGLLRKNSSSSDAPYMVGNASCWSWTDKLKLARYIMNYKFGSTNPSAMYTCVRLVVLYCRILLTGRFCPQRVHRWSCVCWNLYRKVYCNEMFHDCRPFLRQTQTSPFLNENPSKKQPNTSDGWWAWHVEHPDAESSDEVENYWNVEDWSLKEEDFYFTS